MVTSSRGKKGRLLPAANVKRCKSQFEGLIDVDAGYTSSFLLSSCAPSPARLIKQHEILKLKRLAMLAAKAL